jgi:molecular chaperone DnaK
LSTPVIGIDLGTTNSVVAHVDEEGNPQVLKDDHGIGVQPSVVSFHPKGAVLVGEPAKDRKIIDARNTVYSVKRLIGRTFGSPEITAARMRYPFELRQGVNEQPQIVTRAGEFAIPEISAIVLDHMRNIAEQHLRAPVRRAVVTVPANFSDAQRSATATAGAIAGLNVLRVLNEPTAAAIAYGYQRQLNEIMAVYDFGGGTFDVSILRVRGEVFDVLGTAGDSYLGGDDIDERMVDHMVDVFLRTQYVDLRDNFVAMQRLRTVAEQIKIELSRRARALVKIDEVSYGRSGEILDLELEIDRSALIGHVRDIVERTFPVCTEAMRLAGVTTDDVSDVVLVGGSTQIPYVRERVTQFFNCPLRTDIDPATAVAIGAALQASALVEAKPRRTYRAPVAPPGVHSEPPRRTSPMGFPATDIKTLIVDKKDERAETDPGETLSGAGFDAERPTRIKFDEPRVPAEDSADFAAARPTIIADEDEDEDSAFESARPTVIADNDEDDAFKVSRPTVIADQEEEDSDFAAERPTSIDLDGHADERTVVRSDDEDAAASPAQLYAAGQETVIAQDAGIAPDTVLDMSDMLGEDTIVTQAIPIDPENDPDEAQDESDTEDLPTSDIGSLIFGEEEHTAATMLPPEIVAELEAEESGLIVEVEEDEEPPEETKNKRYGAPAKGSPARDYKSVVSRLPRLQTEDEPTAIVEHAELAGGEELAAEAPDEADVPELPVPIRRNTGTFRIPEYVPEMTFRPVTGEMPEAADSQEFDSAPTEMRDDEDDELEAGTNIRPSKRSSEVFNARQTRDQPAAKRVQAGRALSFERPPIHESPAGPEVPAAGPAERTMGIPVVHDVTPLTLGIGTIGGYCEHLIPRNSRVPSEVVRVFATSKHYQHIVEIPICQGESRRLWDNLVLGSLVLDGLPPQPRGQVKVEVTFHIDSSGLLRVSARDLVTKREQVAMLHLLGAQLPDQVAQASQRLRVLRP